MKNGALIILLLLLVNLSSAQRRDSIVVYFNSAKVNVSDGDKRRVDSLIASAVLSKIVVEAHCDKIGSDAYNDGLANRRALEVWKYLSVKGIASEVISYKGFGKRRLINSNSTEEERALNRRAVISFVKKAAIPIKDSIIVLKDDEETPRRPQTFSSDANSINLDNIEIGGTFKLENLNFEGGRHILLKKAEKPLQLLLKTMQDNPNMEIIIEGHICCLLDGGDGRDIDTRNDNLSVNRAKAVYNYLVEHGIDHRRMSYRGYGSSRKLVPERTEEDRSTNRRVEIKVIRK